MRLPLGITIFCCQQDIPQDEFIETLYNRVMYFIGLMVGRTPFAKALGFRFNHLNQANDIEGVRMSYNSDILRVGFKKMHLAIMVGIAVVGAISIALSVIFHARIHTTVQPIVINEQNPLHVLVAIRGNSVSPSLVAFQTVVTLRSHTLTVTPLSGQTRVSIHGVREPLYQAVSTLPSKQAVALISKTYGVPFHHYFFLTGTDLVKVFNALYYHSPSWPESQTPLTMEATMGYPKGRIHPQQEIRLLNEVIHGLPNVRPIAASGLLAMVENTKSNLTSYQLFQLGNYIRGDSLQLGHQPTRIHKGG